MPPLPPILVTGGAGFIGSHLCETLAAAGQRVVALDDLFTGRRENLAAIAANPQFAFVQGSVLDEELVGRLVDQSAAVFHLASAVGVRLVIDKPVQTIETIFNGTDVVLRAARRHNRRVLLTSSSEVYGKGSRVPFCEGDDVVLGPTTTRRWLYACAKMLDEFLALAHFHEAGLPVVCVRLFNTVGPRQTGQYGMVLPRFVTQALRDEPLTVYGDGHQTRCFCHVSDVVGAMVKLLDCPAAAGQVINLGSQEEVTINRLAERVIAVTGSRSTTTHVPYDQAYGEGFEDMLRRVPDTALAHRLVGFEPKVRLDEAIESVAAGVRDAGP